MTAILDAAQDLLAERGLDGFTTNAIAERAGVNIATLYGYFSDKTAVLHELSDRYEQQRADYMSNLATRFESATDWREIVTATIEHLTRMRREVPGSVELRTAIIAVPELRHLDRRRDESVTAYLTEALLMVRADLDPAAAHRAAATVVTAGAHVLDVACEGEQVDRELLAGFHEMVLAYLERLLD
jgi:AcrR family transcriptional regulator